jgi:hypothetical protein
MSFQYGSFLRIIEVRQERLIFTWHFSLSYVFDFDYSLQWPNHDQLKCFMHQDGGFKDGHLKDNNRSELNLGTVG